LSNRSLTQSRDTSGSLVHTSFLYNNF